MPETKRDIKIELLNDQPSAADAFGGKSHDRIAAAIVDIISQNPGGRAIGLEGAWGSGKSTVIDITAQKLANETDYEGHHFLVIAFDAWAHQDDPIRAVFLQEFTEKIASLPGVDREMWSAFLKRLREKKKTTTEDIRDRLSWVSILAILVLPFYPIAFALLKEADKLGAIPIPVWYSEDTHQFSWWTIPFSWLICLGLFLPHLACLMTWLSWRKTISPRRVFFSDRNVFRSVRKWVSEPKDQHKNRSVWRLYSKETQHRTVEQTLYEVEATTNDFNEAFDKLVAEAARRSYRIVIVLDNLDRLPKETIRSTWATMRNFFAATPGTVRSETLKNVWLIVPFDKSHLEHVFDGADYRSETENRHSQGFIEKTFEIVLRVSPPLLDDYRGYFIENFTKAFSDQISEHDREAVFRLFDIYHTHQSRQITPRVIKGFINSVAAQVRQWGEIIPIQYQALYVLLRDRLSIGPNEIRNPSLLDERTRNFLGDGEWEKYLAAAHFNVPPEKAYQILLRPLIKAALIDDDLDGLSGLHKSPGFELVLHDLLFDEISVLAASEPITFCRIAGTLAKVDIADPALGLLAWKYLVRATRAIVAGVSDDERSVFGIVALIGHAAEPQKIARQFLENLATKFSTDISSSEAGVRWFKAIEAIQTALAQVTSGSVAAEVTKSVQIPVEGRFVLGVAAACAASHNISLNSFKLPRSTNITDLLVAEINLPLGLTAGILRATAQFEAIKSISHQPLIEAIFKRLTENNPPLVANQTEILLGFIWQMLSTQKSLYVELISRLFASGALAGLLTIALRDKRISIESKVIALTIASDNFNLVCGTTSHPVYGELESANAFLASLIQKPEEMPLELQQALADDVSQHDIAPKVIARAISNDNNADFYRLLFRLCAPKAIQTLDVNVILTRYDSIAKVLGEDLADEFAVNFDRWIAFVEDNSKGDVLLNLSDEFFKRSLRLNTKIGQYLGNSVPEWLRLFDRATWVRALAEEDSRLRLLVNCILMKKIPDMGNDFSDALYDYFVSVAAGGNGPKTYSAYFYELPQCLSTENRETLFANMRDHLAGKEPSVKAIITVFGLFGRGIAAKGRLVDEADKIARFIIAPLVAAATAESAGVLRQFASEFAECLEGATENTRGSLQERLADAANKGGNGSKVATEMAALLNIPIVLPNDLAGEEEASAKSEASAE